MNKNQEDNLILDPIDLLARLDPDQRLTEYFDLLAEENKRANLVSRETISSGLPRLAAESILPFESACQMKATNYLDIGSGGGFPAIPILRLGSFNSATMVERTRKKADALRRMLKAFSINATVVERSFEELSFKKPFDLVTIRLVKLTPGLLNATLRALAPEGTFIYYAPWDKGLSMAGLTQSSISYTIPPNQVLKTITILKKTAL